ncbi:unnamed protein product [marine sediment metagenome]|uniref:Uncharacterized protein n=1 Tax=marine sediment metagenome TaxID=412755 RepID=X0ZZI8_9ZZZZ
MSLMKSKLFISLSLIGLVVLCASSVLGVFYFGYQGQIVGNIISGEPLQITTDFEETFLINVDNESQTYSDDLRLFNFAENITMLVDLEILKTNLTQDCEFENDCEVELRKTDYSHTELTDGSNFTLVNGDNNFILEVTCLRRSCNQEIKIDLEMQEAL